LKQLAYAALWSPPELHSLVIFDEFASIGDALQLIDLLLQAREAGMAVVVSTQQLPVERSPLRKALLGAGVLVVHQMGAPEDADAMARALGSRSASEVARQIQLGRAGPLVRRLLRPRESFLVPPDHLAQLAVGRVAIGIRSGQRRVAIVQVAPLVSRTHSRS
jgi:hypothetical protein